jgi:hypothetical protein
MYDIVAHSTNECICAAAVEVLNRDLVVTPHHRRLQAMHAIDHPHCGAVHDDRWQRFRCLCERLHVLVVLALQSW